MKIILARDLILVNFLGCHISESWVSWIGSAATASARRYLKTLSLGSIALQFARVKSTTTALTRFQSLVLTRRGLLSAFISLAASIRAQLRPYLVRGEKNFINFFCPLTTN